MDTFTFKTDEKSADYCSLILDCIVKTKGVTREAALKKMNALWNGHVIWGDRDLIYHEDVEYWAEVIVEHNTK